MWLITIVLLILLGILGIAGWLKSQRPASASHLQPIEQFEGWIGGAGLVWGIVILLRWLSALGAIGYAAGSMVVTLLTALVVIALSLILALPLLQSIFGSGDIMGKVSRLTDRLQPYKLGLGFACLVLALYSLLGRVL
jgi:hypothetical protein